METRAQLEKRETLVVGLLLFGLFFGAGNIIFPVKLGQMAAANYGISAIGFIVTAVGVPILGIISSALSQRHGLKAYSLPLGNFAATAFTLALYLTIGPFFAIPRTATVAFEVGVAPYLKEDNGLPLFIYSFIFFFLVWFFTRKPSKLINVVGKVMTPLFIVLIAIFLLAVLFYPVNQPSAYEPVGEYAGRAFTQGMLGGYNTMDALAALAFAIVINDNIKNLGIKKSKRIAVETMRSSLITILIFSLIYGGLVYLGAASRDLSQLDQNGGYILALVCKHYFGDVGQILLALTIGVACLKTSIGLVVSISETFGQLFPKTSYKFWRYAFVLFSFGVANFGLDSIIQWSIPILMLLYPIAMALIFLWILRSFWNFSDLIFKTTIFFVFLAAIFDLLANLPLGLNEVPLSVSLLDFAQAYLPLYSFGLGWVCPSLVGFALGLVLCLIRGKASLKADPSAKN